MPGLFNRTREYINHATLMKRLRENGIIEAISSGTFKPSKLLQGEIRKHLIQFRSNPEQTVTRSLYNKAEAERVIGLIKAEIDQIRLDRFSQDLSKHGVLRLNVTDRDGSAPMVGEAGITDMKKETTRLLQQKIEVATSATEAESLKETFEYFVSQGLSAPVHKLRQ